MGGRRLVLDVSLSWHSKIQGQIWKKLFHGYSKNTVSPKVMTFSTLEVFEQKFMQSFGKDLGKQILHQFVQDEF